MNHTFHLRFLKKNLIFVIILCENQCTSECEAENDTYMTKPAPYQDGKFVVRLSVNKYFC